MKHPIGNALLAGFLGAGSVLTGLQALKSQNSESIAAHVKAATVEVIVSNGVGAGFFINPRGDFVTAYHVIKEEGKNADQEGDNIEVVLADGSKHPVAVAYKNEVDDIAVLHVDGMKRHPCLKFDNSDDLHTTDTVLVAGYPFDTGQQVDTDFISEPKAKSPNEGDHHIYVKLSGPMNPGDSGGPCVSMKTGKVIGMNDEMIAPRGPFSPPQSAGIGLLIPSNTIMKDLREYQNSLDKLNFLKPSISLTVGKYHLDL